MTEPVAAVQEPALVADPARYDGIDLTGATPSDGLQTLLDSLPSNAYKKSIQLLPGTYYRPDGFTIDRPNVLLKGAGPGSPGISGGRTSYSTTELRASATGAAVLTIGNSAGTDWRGSQVRNVAISDGSPGRDQVAYGIKILRQNGGVLEDVAIHDLTAAAGIYSDPVVGNPQYWTLRSPQIVNVLHGILQSASSSDWSVHGGYIWGVTARATAPRPGGVGLTDHGTMKVYGLAVQSFETEVRILGANSQYHGLTIESSRSFTDGLPVVGVEVGAGAVGNAIHMEHANAYKYTTGRALSFMAGSARNYATVMNNVDDVPRVGDDNDGATRNRWLENNTGANALQLANQGPLPTPSAAYRGTFRVAYGAAGSDDEVKVCVRRANGSYAWVSAIG